MSEYHACPSCASGGMRVIYQLADVPTNSVLLLPSRAEALGFPTGDISLGFCGECGFIANIAFEPSLLEYSSRYEATQSCSPTFNAFAHRLATRLVERYDLHGKDIIEIGCGQGEFLTMLCELGDNRGVGFDPAYIGTREEGTSRERITFVKDFYSEAYASYRADFVCCKMTLEHIHDTAGFVSTVRRSLDAQPDAIVFFQVPDVTRILREIAFWDIYYEHCSYFSPGSLARLFRRCGFDVLDLAREYDDQYLMIEAKPGDGRGNGQLQQEDDLDIVASDVAFFTGVCESRLESWKRDLAELRENGRRAVLWGGGSKAVAFLTTLDIRDGIEYAVDINPLKHGTYIAGAGQEIVAPSFLTEYRPDVVIVMNPVYCEEIQSDLNQLGLNPEVRPLA